jgi:hypothetical protein
MVISVHLRLHQVQLHGICGVFFYNCHLLNGMGILLSLVMALAASSLLSIAFSHAGTHSEEEI